MRSSLSLRHMALMIGLMIPATGIAQDKKPELSSYVETNQNTEPAPFRARIAVSFGLASGQQIVDAGGSYTQTVTGGLPTPSGGSIVGSNVYTQYGPVFIGELGIRANRVAIGFRVTSMRQSFSSGSGVKGDMENQSVTGNMIYFLRGSRINPFIGAGLGIYFVTISSNSYDWNYSDSSVLGLYPKVGIEAGHFILSLDYNFLGTFSKNANYYSSILGGGKYYSTVTREYQLNYLSFTLGYVFGPKL